MRPWVIGLGAALGAGVGYLTNFGFLCIALGVGIAAIYEQKRRRDPNA
jgi:hypothetical protein